MLESQYQSSLTKACEAINRSRDDVCVECVGYLLEELRDDKNLAAFKADVETSNIFIGSLIFVQVRPYHNNRDTVDNEIWCILHSHGSWKGVVQPRHCPHLEIVKQHYTPARYQIVFLPTQSEDLNERNREETEYSLLSCVSFSFFLSSYSFVGSQELAEKVQEVVSPLRDQLDAVVVFPSMPEVMRLNKVGAFTMQNLGQSKSVIGDFMKKKKKVRPRKRSRLSGEVIYGGN